MSNASIQRYVLYLKIWSYPMYVYGLSCIPIASMSVSSAVLSEYTYVPLFVGLHGGFSV